MTLRFETFAFDAVDAEAQARWWAELLRWRIDAEDSEPGEFYVVAPEGEQGTPLGFFQVPDTKAVKNRVHLDLRPDDQDAEVARAEGLGARRVDIGQEADPDCTWVVLADPEGNEFCILGAQPAS